MLSQKQTLIACGPSSVSPHSLHSKLSLMRRHLSKYMFLPAVVLGNFCPVRACASQHVFPDGRPATGVWLSCRTTASGAFSAHYKSGALRIRGRVLTTPYSLNRYLSDRRVNGEKRTVSDSQPDQPSTTKRPRGRPKGSKNRGGKAGGNAPSGSASTSGSAIGGGAA
jgi:hypothetical protein